MAFYNQHIKNPSLTRIVIYSVAFIVALGLFYFSDSTFFTEFQSKWSIMYVLLGWNVILIVRMIVNYIKNKK